MHGGILVTKRLVKRQPRASKARGKHTRFPNLEESSDLSIVQQTDLEQINLDFMESLGAQLFGTLFPNGLELNHHSEEWSDLVITVKNNTITMDIRNIPSSFKTAEPPSPKAVHELLRNWRLVMKMEGQTVIEFGRGVHGVFFDKATATRVMLRNMLGRFLPGLKE